MHTGSYAYTYELLARVVVLIHDLVGGIINPKYSS